jgi:hypothetical protein
VGSLFAFSRSRFLDADIENPDGMFESSLRLRLDDVVLFLARLGWRLPLPHEASVEAGVRLFLPVSPFSAPHFRYHEKGGVLTGSGELYSGTEISPAVTIYLQGAF